MNIKSFSIVLVMFSCAAKHSSESLRAPSIAPDDKTYQQLTHTPMNSNTSGNQGFSLADPLAWTNLILAPELRGTSEISTNPKLGWSLQKFKILIHQMPTNYDVEMILNSPSANENASILFRDTILRIKAANQRNQSVLVKINPGQYRFVSQSSAARDRTPAILLSGLSRVKITGSNRLDPPQFIFTNPYGEGIAIEKSKLLEVSNIRMDYDYPSSYGKVAYMGTSLGDGLIQSDDLFDANTSAALGNPIDAIGSVFSYNSTRKTWFSDYKASHVTFEASDPPVKRSANTFYDKRMAAINAGQEVAILHTRSGYGHAIHAKGRENQDIALKSIHLHSYPNMGVLLSGGRGFSLDSIIIEPAPSRLISGRADGIHIAGIQGDIIIENCQIRGQGDDGLNIHGLAYSISNLAANGNLRIHGPFAPEVGDRLALMSIGNRPLFSSVIQSIASTTSNAYEVGIDWGSCDHICRQNLFREIESEKYFKSLKTRGEEDRIGIAYPINLSSARYIIRNNTFANSGARGMIIEAPHGIVDGNVITQIAGSGIAVVATNSYYLSGLGAVNVKISNSTIKGAAFTKVTPVIPLEGAISVMTPGQPEAFPLLQNLIIRDNNVDRVGLAFASVLRGTNILFTGNRATNYGLSLKSGTENPRILLRSSAGITVLDRD